MREQPNTDCAVLGKLAIGTELYRYEVMDDGWSRVKYNDQDAYVKTEYLATESEYAALKKKEEEEKAKAETESVSNTTADTTQNATTEATQTSTSNAALAASTTTTIPSATTTQTTTEKAAATENSGGGGDSNFNIYDNPELQQTSASYVLNTKSKKFHKPSCSDVAKMSPNNYATANDRNDIINQGYEPCGHCHP